MGNYARIKRIGGGGFGEVWLCRHEGLNVLHAVKFVQPGSVVVPSEFYNEPRLLKELEHDDIVKVFDAGTDAVGDLYIAMEYLRAGGVDSLCTAGPIKLRRLKSLFCPALKGLQFVHDSGYIHRDIKPANILVSDALQGKLGDFGLAIPRAAALTTQPAGTLTYIAPEVFITGEMSVLSDIYAMGVALYEAINGSSFLPAVSNSQVLADAIIKGTFPDRSYYRIYVPLSLKKIINKAMNPDSMKRYQSADQLRAAIEQTSIKCSWREKRTPGSYEWTTDSGTRSLSVEALQKGATWSIEVRHRIKPAGTFRRVTHLCQDFPNEKLALKYVQSILTSLVCGAAVANIRL